MERGGWVVVLTDVDKRGSFEDGGGGVGRIAGEKLGGGVVGDTEVVDGRELGPDVFGLGGW